ncbi:hypothetical protein, partial [Chryseobacterium taichungense]|uniref:hypothetical protein n=1 Tax=Chryseobacterium taichungense TaxID=295069 RepID=UPI0028B24EF4
AAKPPRLTKEMSSDNCCNPGHDGTVLFKSTQNLTSHPLNDDHKKITSETEVINRFEFTSYMKI